MADRKRLIAGNWKMNGLRADGLALARGVAERASEPHRCELLICPPATLLTAIGEATPLIDAKTEGAHASAWVLQDASAPLPMAADGFLDGAIFNPLKPLDYVDGFALARTVRAAWRTSRLETKCCVRSRAASAYWSWFVVTPAHGADLGLSP